VYVDDLVITGLDREDICNFKKEMAAKFTISDFGLLQYYLSIEVKHNVDGISLSQVAYALKILEKAGMVRCNSHQTPMECRLKLRKIVVGSLRYLVNTRPDIAFVVSYVSQLLSEPHEDHLMVVKHIMHYIAGIVNWGVHLKKGSGEIALAGFNDSDFAGDVDSRKAPPVCSSQRACLSIAPPHARCQLNEHGLALVAPPKRRGIAQERARCPAAA
jgi:hypothetical protein